MLGAATERGMTRADPGRLIAAPPEPVERDTLYRPRRRLSPAQRGTAPSAQAPRRPAAYD